MPTTSASHRWAAVAVALTAVTACTDIPGPGVPAPPSAAAPPASAAPPATAALPVGARVAPAVRWRHDMDPGALSPVMAGSRVLVQRQRPADGAGPSRLDVLDIAGGRLLWSVDSPIISSYAAAGTDRVVVAVRESFAAPATVQLRDAADGRVRWEYAGGIGQVAVHGDHVVETMTDRGGVTVLDAATGAVRWTKPQGSPFSSSARPDTVYLTHGTTLDEVDAATGAVRSSAALDRPATYPRVLITGAEPVVVTESAGDDRALTAYTAAGLRKVWSVAGLGGVEPAGAAPVLFTSTGEGTVRRLDARTGSPVWAHDGPDALNGDARIQVGGDLVILASRTAAATLQVDALDARDGHLAWTASQPAVNGGDVVVASGVTYAYGSTDTVGTRWLLRGLDSATGAELWSTPVGLDPRVVPRPVDGGLVAGVAGGMELLTAGS